VFNKDLLHLAPVQWASDEQAGRHRWYYQAGIVMGVQGLGLRVGFITLQSKSGPSQMQQCLAVLVTFRMVSNHGYHFSQRFLFCISNPQFTSCGSQLILEILLIWSLAEETICILYGEFLSVRRCIRCVHT
jgi:hypothetical protein